MEFKARFWYIFFSQLLMVLIWVWLAYSRYHSHYSWRYDYLVCLCTAVLWLISFHRSIYAALFDKPILTINEQSIYDFVNDIRYEWKDVEEIEEKKGFIYIKLYKPSDYLDKIGNWHRRWVKKMWFKPTGKHSLFPINSSLIAEDPNKLLEILDDYSVKAEGIVNTLPK